MKKKTFAYISIVYAVCAALLNADNLYFIGTGDSAGNLTLNTNWGVDGSDPVANKTPTVFDDLFFDSRFDRTSSTVSIDWIGFQELKSVTVKSDYCGVAFRTAAPPDMRAIFHSSREASLWGQSRRRKRQAVRRRNIAA